MPRAYRVAILYRACAARRKYRLDTAIKHHLQHKCLLDTRFIAAGETVHERQIKLTQSLEGWRGERPAANRLVYHYTSCEVAKLIGAVGFKLTSDRIAGLLDIGMAGGGFYFTGISPVEPLGGACWPEGQFFSNLLYANYSSAWRDEGRLRLSSAVVVCSINAGFLQPVPERPEALVFKTGMLGEPNPFGLFLHSNIVAVIQLCDPEMQMQLPEPVLGAVGTKDAFGDAPSLRVTNAPAASVSLRDVLHPLDFKADLDDYASRFVEGTRGWVFSDIDAWLRDPMASRCRVLLGGPGFGKTAVVARLCVTRPDVVVGVHLCRHNDARKRDPRRMVISLAYQLAQAVPEYRAALEAMGERLVREVENQSLGTTELFDLLLVQPLHSILHHAKLLFVIDALDEAEHDKKNELLRLVRAEFAKLPAWLGVLITSRPEIPIKKELRTLKPEELDAEAHVDECDADVRTFLHAVLSPVVPADRLDAAVATVAGKAGRIFLYLHWVRKRIEEEGACLDVTALPDGLAGEYEKQLERIKLPDGSGMPQALDGDMGRILRAILAAAEPLHIRDDLPALSGVKRCRRLVEALSQLFPVREDKVHVFHKSISDWLTGSPPFNDRDDESDYFINCAEGHHMLAENCSITTGAYATRWALHHCAQAGEWGKFEQLATDLWHLQARFAAGSGAALGLELGRATAVAPFQQFVLREMATLLREPTAVHQLAFQQPDDSPVFAQASGGTRLIRWRNKPQQIDALQLTIECSSAVGGLVSLVGSRLVVAAGTNVEVRDVRNGELLEAFAGSSEVHCVAAGGGYFCAGYADGTIKVWDSGVTAAQFAFPCKTDASCLPAQLRWS